MARFASVIGVLLLCCSARAFAADVTVKARIEPPAVTIGTPFRYIVDIDAPKSVELVIPLLGERFGSFLVTDFGDEPPQEKNGRVKVVRWFKLVGYEAGDETLPGYPLEVHPPGGEAEKVEGNPVTVIVQSLLATEPTPLDIRDIAQPEALPTDWRPILLGAGALAALAALAALVYYLVRRRRAADIAIVPLPHEVALAALDRLRVRRLLEAGRFEEYYVALSGIVRTYVEGRFGLHAPEMTSEEFFAAMQRDHRLTAEHRALLGDFLNESDLVKFARHTPAADDGERAYTAAHRFVEESRDVAGRARAAESPPTVGLGTPSAIAEHDDAPA